MSPSPSRKWVPVIAASLSVLVLAGAAFGFWMFHMRSGEKQANGASVPAVESAAATQASSAASLPPQSNDPSAVPAGAPAPLVQAGSDMAPPSAAVAQEQPAANSNNDQGQHLPSSKLLPVKNSADPAVHTALPVAPPVPEYQPFHDKALQSFAASRYIEPAEDNALYWARMARQHGDPNAAQMENEVLGQMVAAVESSRSVRNYNAASALLARLVALFPDHPELVQLDASIRQEQEQAVRQAGEQRRAEEFQAQTKQFGLHHRHLVRLENFTPVYAYCNGDLKITPDGIARFDCMSTSDPRGRCDHLMFRAADIRELRPNRDGSFHLVLPSGKFDFTGDPGDVQEALAALRMLGPK